jgi:hypothetical protein
MRVCDILPSPCGHDHPADRHQGSAPLELPGTHSLRGVQCQAQHAVQPSSMVYVASAQMSGDHDASPPGATGRRCRHSLKRRVAEAGEEATTHGCAF